MVTLELGETVNSPIRSEAYTLIRPKAANRPPLVVTIEALELDDQQALDYFFLRNLILFQERSGYV